MFDDSTSRRFARSTGLAYLMMACVGSFALLWVPSQLIAPNDPLATLTLIGENPALFTAGITAELVMILAEITLGVLLYVMFRPFGETLALTTMITRLMMAAVMATMLMPQAGLYALAVPTSVFTGLEPIIRADHAWALQYIRDAGNWTGQILYGVHLWFLGLLALRSKMVPRWIIYGVFLGGTGYLLDNLRVIILPSSDSLALATTSMFAVVAVSEIAFALWLLRSSAISPSRQL